MIARTEEPRRAATTPNRPPRPYRWMTLAYLVLFVLACLLFAQYAPSPDHWQMFGIGSAIAGGLGYSLARGWRS